MLNSLIFNKMFQNHNAHLQISMREKRLLTNAQITYYPRGTFAGQLNIEVSNET